MHSRHGRCANAPAGEGKPNQCHTTNNPACYAEHTSTEQVVYEWSGMDMRFCVDHCNVSQYFQYHDGSERTVRGDFDKASEYLYIDVTHRPLALYVKVLYLKIH